jgi:hypothetical protein
MPPHKLPQPAHPLVLWYLCFCGRLMPFLHRDCTALRGGAQICCPHQRACAPGRPCWTGCGPLPPAECVVCGTMGRDPAPGVLLPSRVPTAALQAWASPTPAASAPRPPRGCRLSWGRFANIRPARCRFGCALAPGAGLLPPPVGLAALVAGRVVLGLGHGCLRALQPNSALSGTTRGSCGRARASRTPASSPAERRKARRDRALAAAAAWAGRRRVRRCAAAATPPTGERGERGRGGAQAAQAEPAAGTPMERSRAAGSGGRGGAGVDWLTGAWDATGAAPGDTLACFLARVGREGSGEGRWHETDTSYSRRVL